MCQRVRVSHSRTSKSTPKNSSWNCAVYRGEDLRRLGCVIVDREFRISIEIDGEFLINEPPPEGPPRKSSELTGVIVGAGAMIGIVGVFAWIHPGTWNTGGDEDGLSHYHSGAALIGLILVTFLLGPDSAVGLGFVGALLLTATTLSIFPTLDRGKVSVRVVAIIGMSASAMGGFAGFAASEIVLPGKSPGRVHATLCFAVYFIVAMLTVFGLQRARERRRWNESWDE